MVNYDLPWNPNRVEQRFGRIHRIGQTEVCHLWNLVASETREGDVFNTLLHKLEQQRESLGGAVFDVLGKCFTDTPLRSLLMEAIRYGEQPEVRDRLTQKLDSVLDREHLQDLIDERSLTHGIIDTTRLNRIREEMERAEARRLQPHYISSFFQEAFKLLGGSVREREPKRYQVSRVPGAIRNRDRVIGVGEPVLTQYERIAFEKELLAVQGKPLAAFVCPGHPLLDATLDLILERDRDLLKRGAVLVDPHGQNDAVRVMFYLEQKIQDGRVNPNGGRWIVSEQMQFVEIDENMTIHQPGYAPYLDYRPITEDERALVTDVLEADWLSANIESQIIGYAVEQLIPEHLSEVKEHKEELVQKTLEAVKDRLTKEINYWDHRASQLKRDEEAGRRNARMNAALAGQRADELTARLERRTEELERERQISPLPPVLIGGGLVVPQALLDRLTERQKLPSNPRSVNGLTGWRWLPLWRRNADSDVSRERWHTRIRVTTLSPRIRRAITCCSLRSKEKRSARPRSPPQRRKS